MKTKIAQIFTALTELEGKGCHAVFFEYGNGMLRVRIFEGEAIAEKALYKRVIDPTREPAELDKLLDRIESLNRHVWTTPFQCFRREFVIGERAGQWEKTKPAFVFGDKATHAMLIDGSGYSIDDPENRVQYFVSYNEVSDTNKQ